MLKILKTLSLIGCLMTWPVLLVGLGLSGLVYIGILTLYKCIIEALGKVVGLVDKIAEGIRDAIIIPELAMSEVRQVRLFLQVRDEVMKARKYIPHDQSCYKWNDVWKCVPLCPKRYESVSGQRMAMAVAEPPKIKITTYLPIADGKAVEVISNGSVAQTGLEQPPYKGQVGGSNPPTTTKEIKVFIGEG